MLTFLTLTLLAAVIVDYVLSLELANVRCRKTILKTCKRSPNLAKPFLPILPFCDNSHEINTYHAVRTLSSALQKSRMSINLPCIAKGCFDFGALAPPRSALPTTMEIAGITNFRILSATRIAACSTKASEPNGWTNLPLEL